ncbi:unnamed protein product [Ectocarpus sp. 13 AM-2016]
MDRGGGGDDADDDLLSEVKGRDWRLFRKNLISRYGEDNGKDPWSDGCWAHDIGTVEAGCLLIATEEIDSGTFHQSVILVLSHARDQGTLGLILNRPGPQRLHSLPGLQPGLAEVFGDSQVEKERKRGLNFQPCFLCCGGKHDCFCHQFCLWWEHGPSLPPHECFSSRNVCCTCNKTPTLCAAPTRVGKHQHE